MEQYTISHSEKGFLAERESHYRKIHDGWKRIFEDCTKKESVLLENIIPNRKLHEANISSDIGGYDGFVLNLVRRVYANLISKDLVSVQPMIAPVGRLFYLDPQITTGTSSNYQSMYDSHYDSSNYDVSRGSYTILTGTPTSISETNYNSGSPFNISYSGGMDGLGGLLIKALCNLYTDMVYSDSSNVTVTCSPVDIPNVFISDPSLFFNNNLGDTPLLIAQNISGWTKIVFNTTPTQPVKRYSICFNGILTAKYWEFCGSTNGTSWTLLDKRVDESPVPLIAYNYYTPTDISTPYKYYMFTGISSNATAVQITDIELSSGCTNDENMIYAISPTTWGNDFISNNTINIVANQTGSSLVGTATVYSEWKNYNSLEGTSGFQQVKLNVTSTTVETISRKLYSHLTEELLQDAEANFGLNFEGDLAELMSTEVAAEIDREIIQDLINIAPYRSEWYYDVAEASAATSTWYQLQEVPEGYTQHAWAKESLITEINKMDGQLRKANIYHGANWLLCSTKVGMVIESMKEHKVIKGNSVVNKTKIHRTGRLRSSIDVYVDPYLPDNICLMGYNGDNWDAGYIYAPYVLVNSDTVIDPDTLFDHYLSFHSRYGKKIVTNKKYGLINCHFPSGGEFELVNEV